MVNTAFKLLLLKKIKLLIMTNKLLFFYFLTNLNSKNWLKIKQKFLIYNLNYFHLTSLNKLLKTSNSKNLFFDSLFILYFKNNLGKDLSINFLLKITEKLKIVGILLKTNIYLVNQIIFITSLKYIINIKYIFYFLINLTKNVLIFNFFKN